jgi:hypothetical protein
LASNAGEPHPAKNYYLPGDLEAQIEAFVADYASDGGMGGFRQRRRSGRTRNDAHKGSLVKGSEAMR